MINQLKMLQYCMCQLFLKSLLHSHTTVSQSHLTPTAISSNINFSTNTCNCQLCFWFVLIFTFHMQPSTDSGHYNTWQLTSNRSHLQPCSSLPLPQCDRLQFTQYNTWILIHFNLQIWSKSPLKHTVWKRLQHVLYPTTAWEVHHTSNRKLSSLSLQAVAHYIIHSIRSIFSRNFTFKLKKRQIQCSDIPNTQCSKIKLPYCIHYTKHNAHKGFLN
jgi:hypothetical protein